VFSGKGDFTGKITVFEGFSQKTHTKFENFFVDVSGTLSRGQSDTSNAVSQLDFF